MGLRLLCCTVAIMGLFHGDVNVEAKNFRSVQVFTKFGLICFPGLNANFALRRRQTYRRTFMNIHASCVISTVMQSAI